jgi:hypothetical protein
VLNDWLTNQPIRSFAALLMRPEYRSKIDAKYKDKIEKIVRWVGGLACSVH